MNDVTDTDTSVTRGLPGLECPAPRPAGGSSGCFPRARVTFVRLSQDSNMTGSRMMLSVALAVAALGRLPPRHTGRRWPSMNGVGAHLHSIEIAMHSHRSNHLKEQS